VLTLIIAVIVIKSFSDQAGIAIILMGIFTWFSLFIQCSYFNYYNLKYSQALDKTNLNSKLDESKADDTQDSFIIRGLRLKYNLLYGWQDRLIEALDKMNLDALQKSPAFDQGKWYSHKTFLTLNSALCFGTHIFIFILCIIFRNPSLALMIISIIFNVYFLAVMAGRYLYFKAIFKAGKL